MKAQALLRVSLTVSDLDRLAAFYEQALGFTAIAPAAPDPALATLLCAGRLRTIRLRRGAQSIELAEFDPPGAPYPQDSRSNDAWFQHLALATGDMRAACDRLRPHAHAMISRGGPQTLPGGITALKFRDPDGHPLELIQVPNPDPATEGGIDHTAIAVADATRSIAFYTSKLGLAVASRQLNTGKPQDALDDLDATSVDVVALAPATVFPHIELLGYRSPAGRAASPLRPNALAATRTILAIDQPDETRLIHDPDGHALLLIGS